MEAAKSAVNKIIHRGGQHDTHVTETVNPAVTQETIKPTRHENVTQAVDKEVHQDHYHTTVQPIEHREVLPEQHQHNVLPVQEKEFRHGDDSHVSRAVNTEAAQFKDTSRTAGTTHTQSQGATATGEHVHHHVHESVQPVIHKETVAPEVMHTTVPVHERHQAPAEHHGMSVLPTKTMSEVKNLGHSLTGGTHREEHYEGDPRKYNENMQSVRHDVDTNFGEHDGLHGHHTSGDTGVGSTNRTTATGGLADRATGHHERDIASGTAGRSAIRDANIGASTNLSEGNRLTSGQGSNTQNLATSGYDNNNSHTHGPTSGAGHGTTNQLHHGTARDNVDPNVHDDNVQHGTQPRDPAVLEERGDKKLTGSGVDGSHSALFGLTPDGHTHGDTSHGSGKLQPAHSKNTSNTTTAGTRGGDQDRLAEQMRDTGFADRAQGGPQDTSAMGTAKPGAGATGGSQGFGNIRPEQHGATGKLENKLDPTTDADRDGKRGVMD